VTPAPPLTPMASLLLHFALTMQTMGSKYLLNN
jgi:hypothetical protein